MRQQRSPESFSIISSSPQSAPARQAPPASPQVQASSTGTLSNWQEERKTTGSLGRARHRRRHLFLDLPIAGRLTLGFLVAALVAALAAGAVGIQRAQSLGRQSDFYQHLLQVNTSLTTGRSFLQLMDSKLHQTLNDAGAAQPSKETLTADKDAIVNLTTLYNNTLSLYVQNDLLTMHPDQVTLLNEADQGDVVDQQGTLTSSALRTWRLYQAAQQQVMNYLAAGDLKNALLFERAQGEPTNADALSALRGLIQLNDQMASAIREAANVEEQSQILITIIATVLAFMVIALVGWFISDTLVRRLQELRRVTRSVEEGQLRSRVAVIGRDEIADVSVSVNVMLDTIVGLLQETQRQRDALTNAAQHLFSDMRVVNAGDLRVSAAVSNDPIGMLGNAFNFTIGRFRRFVLRSQTIIDQLDVIARQENERIESFVQHIQRYVHDIPDSSGEGQTPHVRSGSLPGATIPTPRKSALRKHSSLRPETEDEIRGGMLARQVKQVQSEVLQETRADLGLRLQSARDMIEQIYASATRLNESISLRPKVRLGGEELTRQVQELVVLEKMLVKLGREITSLQLQTTNDLGKIDEALSHVAHAASGIGPIENTYQSAPPPSSNFETQELAQLALAFAREMNSFSQGLLKIKQEMHTTVAPFRLEERPENGRHASPS